MQGFLDLKMKKWTRNLMTRWIAITPSLIVSIVGGSSGAGRLIIIASVYPLINPSISMAVISEHFRLTFGTVCLQMILSFELPFALIPLLKFSSSSKTKMGPHRNSIIVSSFFPEKFDFRLPRFSFSP